VSMGRRLPVLALLALAACADMTPPPRPAAPPPAPANSIFVSRGETVYDVAKRYKVPVRDLIEANRLAPPYALQAGQRLTLPLPREYTVRAGDTVYGISRQFNLDSSELVRLNAIPAPYTIQVGQVLRLPSARQGGAPPTQVAAAPPQAAPPPQRPAAAPAQRPQVAALPPAGTAAPPPAAAPRRSIETVELPPQEPAAQPSQQPAAGARPAPPASAAVSPVKKGIDAAELPPPGSAPAAAPAPSQAAPPQTTPAAPPQTQVAALPPPAAPAPPPVEAKPPPRTSSRFAWPLSGGILSAFGPKPGGTHNDGINIGAPKGTPVTAADDGIVAYAGNELRGFGNLLLVRHADGWVTAYAHLDQMLVERGARVSRGQRIGTVGATGNVRGPQLHFEIRQGNRAVDPIEQLERR